MKRAIAVAAFVRATPDEIAALIANDPGAVFGERDATPDADPGSGRYSCDLHVDGRNGSIRHKVVAKVRMAKDGDGWNLGIAPVGGGHLLPTFEGTLRAVHGAQATELSLTGTYDPPLGHVGAFGDGLIGHRVARQSLQAFVDEVARRVDAAVAERLPEGGFAAPYPPDLRDKEPVPGMWLG